SLRFGWRAESCAPASPCGSIAAKAGAWRSTDLRLNFFIYRDFLASLDSFQHDNFSSEQGTGYTDVEDNRLPRPPLPRVGSTRSVARQSGSGPRRGGRESAPRPTPLSTGSKSRWRS